MASPIHARSAQRQRDARRRGARSRTDGQRSRQGHRAPAPPRRRPSRRDRRAPRPTRGHDPREGITRTAPASAGASFFQEPPLTRGQEPPLTRVNVHGCAMTNRWGSAPNPAGVPPLTPDTTSPRARAQGTRPRAGNGKTQQQLAGRYRKSRGGVRVKPILLPHPKVRS